MNEQKKPYVQNVANEDQIRKAGTKVEIRRNRELNDICSALHSPQAKRFFWRILRYCKMDEDIWTPSAEIHKFAGMRLVGLFIKGEICEANEEIFMEMIRENKRELEKNA